MKFGPLSPLPISVLGERGCFGVYTVSWATAEVESENSPLALVTWPCKNVS